MRATCSVYSEYMQSLLAARLLAATTPLILGSGSASRAAILREAGLTFDVLKPDIDEKAIRFEDPEELVLALGRAKAKAVIEGPRGDELARAKALLLTGDQVVVSGGVILEKPESEAEARKFIAGYAKAPPKTVGSCVVTDCTSGQQWSALDVTQVHFSPDGLPAETIDALIAEGSVFYCAGGLMIEHELVAPHVQRIDGTMDAVMGLCVETVGRLVGEALDAR